MTKIERLIVHSRPITFIRETSKKISPWGFEGLSIYTVFHFFANQIKKEGLTVRASAISFNFIMAIPAATLFLFTLVPYLAISNDIHAELIKIIEDLTPNTSTQNAISHFLDDYFSQPKTGLLSFGFLLTLFYASNAIMGIIRTFDRSLLYKHKSNFINKRLRAFKLILILVVLLIATTLISIGQGQLFTWLLGKMKIQSSTSVAWLQFVRWVIIVLLFLYSIGFIYRYAPSFKERWKLISPGSLLATFLVILTTIIFSYWAQNFSNYNKIYGSIGTILMLILLVNLNSFILLVGFELNISIMYLKEHEKKSKSLQSDK
ncbi:MAG: YihY/virulence factor BrkB family protein [Chitinophagaceae bacterium]